MKTNLLPAGLRLLCAALFSTLSLCRANGGMPRPTEFKTRSSGPYLMILTRKKD
jgi:hypothetical protein